MFVLPYKRFTPRDLEPQLWFVAEDNTEADGTEITEWVNRGADRDWETNILMNHQQHQYNITI